MIKNNFYTIEDSPKQKELGKVLAWKLFHFTSQMMYYK